ncbi:hypothetical protein RHMOL_Rhmol03G0131700 [Rhododendron molle]|uniref:Uncharacterized protein n=1 Tax=Rhododendron molle TaxID=49168 RepID=A0ACC0PF31_RHOML|nr:hypothetical protein RHMOL_Rhmol03G0131700 [Rhododendron molle]
MMHLMERNGISSTAKRWSLAYARIQGNAAFIAHFQNSILMNRDKRYRPILFNTDGPNAGDQVCAKLTPYTCYRHHYKTSKLAVDLTRNDKNRCWHLFNTLYVAIFIVLSLLLKRRGMACTMAVGRFARLKWTPNR